jgi:hypothetical protein
MQINSLFERCLTEITSFSFICFSTRRLSDRIEIFANDDVNFPFQKEDKEFDFEDFEAFSVDDNLSVDKKTFEWDFCTRL